MNIKKTKPFDNFKSYNHFTNKQNKNDSNNKSAKFVKPLIGATIGTAGAYLACKKSPKFKNETLNELKEILFMAGGANIGGVFAGSIGATKEQKEKKWKEAGFQIMNIAIPMSLVSSALEFCKHNKTLNNNPCKIIGSIVGMLGGAAIATAVTNLTKDNDEPYRKYSLKDSISNFDDMVATVKIGFKDIAKKIPVDKILPFIYIYTGVRSGKKE